MQVLELHLQQVRMKCDFIQWKCNIHVHLQLSED